MYPNDRPPPPPSPKQPPHSQHPPNSTRASRRLVQDLFLHQKNTSDDEFFWSLIAHPIHSTDGWTDDTEEVALDWKGGVGGGVNFKDYEKIEVVREGPETGDVEPIKGEDYLLAVCYNLK